MTIEPQHLRDARDRFQALIQNRNTPEAEWQRLFSDCPFIFSESLPVRIHEEDIRPLARPGRAEPDFVFFPGHPSSLSCYGVVELKRADTRLIRIPRKDVLDLSADASAAVAQARKYADELRAEPIIRPDQLLMIGNELHIFIIAGMSDEIASKITNEILMAQYHRLLPEKCRIIPFDTLLSAFESSLPPAVHILNTWLPLSRGTFRRFLSEVETTYSSYRGYYLDDSVFDLWSSLEDEYEWMLGPRHSYKRAISPREWYEGAPPGPDGRSGLATEAPNPSMFAEEACRFVRNVVRKARELRIETELSDDLRTL